MASISTKNADTSILTANASPAKACSVVMATFTHAREAAILATCSVIAYLMNVNHLRSATDKDNYLSRNDAVKYIKEQLEAQTSVKNGMLDRYVGIGNDLYGRLNNDKHMPLINSLAKLTNDTVKEGPALVQKYLKDKAGVESLADAMRLLGYSTGHDRQGGAGVGADPTKADERAKDTIANAIKTLTDKAHVPARTAAKRVAQNVAAGFSDPVILAEQAMSRVTDVDDLMKLIDMANKLIDKLNAATEGAAEKTKTAAPRKPRTRRSGDQPTA